MKFIALFLVILTACKLSNPKKKEKTKVLVFTITDNDSIIGSWKMCSEYTDGMRISYNDCPTVIFYRNGTGSVGNSPFPSETFTWSLKKNVLSVSYPVRKTGNTFADSAYVATIANEADKITLDIYHPAKKTGFSLSR